MSTYESAPVTKLVAECCCFCGKALAKAESVETGVGPDCRKKHGVDEAQGAPDFVLAEKRLGAALPAPGDARKSVDVLLYRIAAEQKGPACARAVGAIQALGFTKVAARLAKRLGGVKVTTIGEGAGALLCLKPKGLDEELFATYLRAMRAVGGRWNEETKVTEVPASSSVALWRGLKAALPAGTLVVGPKGIASL